MERHRARRFDSIRRSRAAGSFLMRSHENAQLRRRLLILWSKEDEGKGPGAQISIPASQERIW